jgi:hypothetical protein
MNKPLSPPIHILLREAFLQFYEELPQDVAVLRISPNELPKAFSAEIIPRSPRASRISATGEEGDWEAMVAFGKKCQIDARYYNSPDSNQAFKDEVLTICRAVARSHWQEKIVRRGDRILRAIAMLPPPIGTVQQVGWRPFSFSLLKKQTEESINWEPYVCLEHGIPEKAASSLSGGA